MKIDKFNYYFKVRPYKDVALNLGVIYKDLGYFKIDKNKISQIYGLTEQDINHKNYLQNFEEKVKILCDNNNDKLAGKCLQLQRMWNDYCIEYFDIISKVFEIEIVKDVTFNTYCYLQHLPINQVDLNNNVIYLDCNKEVTELFKNFIIMLTKLILLKRWNDYNDWKFNTDFEINNKVWIFADIAIDAIFINSDLVKICSNPSYKYFYSLRVEGVNTIEHFRKIYKQKTLDEFFTELYIFIRKNYQRFLKFKHYLY